MSRERVGFFIAIYLGAQTGGEKKMDKRRLCRKEPRD